MCNSKILKFIMEVLRFLVSIGLMLAIGFFLPPTPKARNTFLYSNLLKDSLMLNVPGPRIILVGGSGLGMGINSKYLSQLSGLNVVNAGVAKSIGIVYTMDNSLRYIEHGDIIILCPEYHNYFNRFAYGNSYLLRTIMDTDRSGMFRLRLNQYINTVPHLMYYLVTKFKPSEYTYVDTHSTYDMSAFNAYGDMCNHWGREGNYVTNENSLGGTLNYELTSIIDLYSDNIMELGGELLITYPAYQQSSFDSSLEYIEMIDNEFNMLEVRLLGTPERYRFPDSLMYNSSYHLTREGAFVRTKLLFEDLVTAGIL